MRIEPKILKDYCNLIRSGEAINDWDNFLQYQKTILDCKNKTKHKCIIDKSKKAFSLIDTLEDEILIETLKKRGYTILEIM